MQSRYYNPETGRFINADALLLIRNSIFDSNLFTYCENNPVNRVDYSGLLSAPCVIAAHGYGGTPDASKTTDNTLDSLLGAGITSEYHSTQEKELMLPLLNLFLTVKLGTTQVSTVSSKGNSDAFLSGYAIHRLDNVLLSSVGAKINICNYTVDCSLGADNISLSFVERIGNTEYAGAIVIDPAHLKAGIEGSITSPVPGCPNTTYTEYVNVSITGYTVISLLLFVLTGNYYPQQGMMPGQLPGV